MKQIRFFTIFTVIFGIGVLIGVVSFSGGFQAREEGTMSLSVNASDAIKIIVNDSMFPCIYRIITECRTGGLSGPPLFMRAYMT